MRVSKLFRLFFFVCITILVACKKDTFEKTPDTWIVTGFADPNNVTYNSIYLSDAQVPVIFEKTAGSGFFGVYGLTVHPAEKKLYFFANDSSLYRSNPDFTDVEVMGNVGKQTGSSNTTGLLQSSVYENRLYRTEYSDFHGELVSSKLDGSDRREWDYSPWFFRLSAFALPPGTEFIYLMPAFDKKVYRSALSIMPTSEPQLIYDLSEDTSIQYFTDIEVFENTLYIGTNKGIYSGSIDGKTKLQRMFVNEAQIIDYNCMTFDYHRKKLFWISAVPEERNTFHIGQPYLYKGNFDGTGAEMLLRQLGGRAFLSVLQD